MRATTRQLYGIAAVLAIAAAILQLIDREWFRGATGVVIAVAMVLAAMGFPERSQGHRRIYSGLIGLMIVLLSVQLYLRFSGP